MTTRSALVAIFWMILWAVAMGIRFHAAISPVPNAYLSSEDDADLPVMAR